MMRRLLLLVALVGCARTWTDFHPYSATSVKSAVTERAVFAYPGDVARLRKAGAVLVGTVDASGNGYADRDDVRDSALSQAAELGGTHVFIASEGASTAWAQVTPDRATTRVYGNEATTTFRQGMTLPVTKYGGSYLIVRVVPELWSRLPHQLRPVPNEHARARIRDYEREAAADDAQAESDDAEDADRSHSEAARQEQPEPTAVPQVNWYCQSADHDAQCFRDRDDCLAVEDDTKCDEESAAYCFAGRAKDAGEGAHASLRCYGTIDDCHAARDTAFTSGLQITNECAESH